MRPRGHDVPASDAPRKPSRGTVAPGRDVPPDDAAAFRDAVRDVRPLPAPPRVTERPRPPPVAQFRRADDEAVLAESLELAPGELFVETGDELLFRRAHVSGRTLRRLQRGEFRVEDEIDLHGLVAVEAREALRAFLNTAVKRGMRCVRVIHGKGLRSGPRGPVLKHAVNIWLRKCGPVLAFGSARQVDGGTGAVYVLLER